MWHVQHKYRIIKENTRHNIEKFLQLNSEFLRLIQAIYSSPFKLENVECFVYLF